MPQDNTLSAFLINTGKALRYGSVEELNEATVEYLKNKNKHSPAIDTILDLVSECYAISKRTLKTSNARGKVQVARNMAYCLLHFDAGLPTRYIAIQIFGKWQTSVTKGITYYKNLDMQIRRDADFMDTYTKLQLKLNQHDKNL